ncbi:hypothetical protein ABZ907_17945 [Nonomuraea wenchangensis]
MLSVTSEHAADMICTSLITVSHRTTSFLANTALVGLVTFVSASAALLTTWALSRVIANRRSLAFNSASLSDDLPMLLVLPPSPPLPSSSLIPPPPLPSATTFFRRRDA